MLDIAFYSQDREEAAHRAPARNPRNRVSAIIPASPLRYRKKPAF